MEFRKIKMENRIRMEKKNDIWEKIKWISYGPTYNNKEDNWNS